MKMFKSKEFRRSVMPLIIANSIFTTGLQEYFDDRRIQVIGFVYANIMIISYCSSIYWLLDIISTIWEYRSTYVATAAASFQIVHNIVIYVWTIVAGCFRRKKIKLSVTQLENCARAMDELGIAGSYSAAISRKCFWGPLLYIWIVLQMMHDVVQLRHSNRDPIVLSMLSISDGLPQIAYLLVDFTFIYWIRFTRIKFNQLNTLLKNMLTTTINSPQHRRVLRMWDGWKDGSSSSATHRNYKSRENVNKLKRVKQIHLELTKCAKITNDAYGPHILLSMTKSFIIITALLYNVYDSLIAKKWTTHPNAFVTFLFCVVYIGSEMLAVNHICAMTAKEIADFIRQLTQNCLTFTACGFFDLDYTFIYSTVGSITTYLVILIQIGSGSDKVVMNNTNNSMTLSADSIFDNVSTISTLL